MKSWTRLLLSSLIAITLNSCYVSSLKPIYKDGTCNAGKILIVSKIDKRTEPYIEDLCEGLAGKLIDNKFEVLKYVTADYDSTHFSNILKSENLNSILFLFPKNKFKYYSTGFVTVTYSVELYNRNTTKNKLVYKGLIDISYRDDKQTIVLNKSVNTIYKGIFQLKNK